MTKEEAIQILSTRDAHGVLCGYTSGVIEAYDMAIEALKQPFDKMQLLNDGTLKVRVANVLDIKRVMVMDDNIIYDSYYPDRPKGEWIDEDGNNVPLHKDGYPLRSCYCNQCHEWLVASDEYGVKGNFCPTCGADMRGEK